MAQQAPKTRPTSPKTATRRLEKATYPQKTAGGLAHAANKRPTSPDFFTDSAFVPENTEQTCGQVWASSVRSM
jgi:hypothetical protein